LHIRFQYLKINTIVNSSSEVFIYILQVRTGKPFNPLLGETFECDRLDDLGWRCFNEQVSHHPPMAAQYCEGRGWKCWQEFTMSSKFRGKYLQVIPLGIAHLVFTESGMLFLVKH